MRAAITNMNASFAAQLEAQQLSYEQTVRLVNHTMAAGTWCGLYIDNTGTSSSMHTTHYVNDQLNTSATTVLCQGQNPPGLVVLQHTYVSMRLFEDWRPKLL